MENSKETEVIGDTYNVVQLEKFNGALKMATRKFRVLESDEVLVKVMCSTIHPADLSFLRGTYGADKPELPMIPGFEGSGIIVKSGSKVDSSLIGKRCGVIGNQNKKGPYEGLWAQYLYTSPKDLMIFDEEIPYETICFSIGNPLTAVGFLDTLRKKNATSVGQNGASSSFGKIFIRLCKTEGMKTVNIVRKQEYVEQLKSLGADYVYSTSDPKWQDEFKNTAKELNITNFFECVGGNFTGITMQLLPPSSTMYHFGNLELKRLGEIDTSDFIFQNKVLRGWWLSGWMQSLTKEELTYWRNYIVKDLMSGSDMLKTNVSKEFPLEEFESAFEYYLTNMSEGKIIMRPNN